MTTLTVLYGTPTDPEAFRGHYEAVHLPLARAIPGAEDLSYSLRVGRIAGDADVFASFRASFPSRAALDAALASPEGVAAQADVPAFATGGVTILVED